MAFREFDGPENNPIILGWAKELNHSISQWYRSDSEAWCALYMSYVCMKAGYQPPDGFDAIRARSFAKWGDPIAGDPVLGDILVFSSRWWRSCRYLCRRRRGQSVIMC